jgi:SOS response associated peptidase (SRAP)
VGLIASWWSKPLKEMKLATFNARAETVATKPMFRSAFKRNRCLIPVSGYYEWQDTPGGKQPWYFTARDGDQGGNNKCPTELPHLENTMVFQNDNEGDGGSDGTRTRDLRRDRPTL